MPQIRPRFEQSRTLERRRARRRRRRRAVGSVLLAAVLSAGVLLATHEGGSSSPRHAVASRSPARLVSRPSVRRGPTLAAQLAAVRRLAARGLPLFCGGREKRMVALTFDDGPGVYTRLALDKLRRAHLKATFFLVGEEISAFPRLPRLEKPYAAFGDHTMTHPFLPGLDHAGMVREIVRARRLIERTVGEQVDLFRPPYEGRSPAIQAEVRSAGMLQVLWNVDSRDSLGADYAGIERNVVAGLHPGSIILMHENHGQTIRALPTIFAALRRERLQAVTVPELVAEDPPTPRHLRAGGGGCPVKLLGGSGA